MTQRRLVFHPEAEADIGEILDFYAERDLALPARFRARLKEQVDCVMLFRRAGGVLFEEYRRVLLRRFPFMVAVAALGQHRRTEGSHQRPTVANAEDRRWTAMSDSR